MLVVVVGAASANIAAIAVASVVDAALVASRSMQILQLQDSHEVAASDANKYFSWCCCWYC